MNVDIQSRAFPLTVALKRFVENRITQPLGKRHERIKRVLVRLGDVNGPRGGKDKYCRITVQIPGQKDVYVEDVKSNLYTAIHRAAERTQRSVLRRVSRLRERSFRDSHRQKQKVLLHTSSD